jgi:subtilisin family serine protease
MKATACSTPSSAGSWGLTRISQQKAVNPDGRYTFPDAAGKGVTVYVVDTGVYVDNVDFEGRATFGWKYEASWSSTDANGHGTHVASTVAGKFYGVAREAKIVGVKVLGDNGSGTNTGVIAGIDWAVSSILSLGQTGVINMSLGGGLSTALNAAVNAAVADNVVVVVAAGNENANACGGSPSSAADAITVGATEQDITKDWRSVFSNYGTCVNIFAPGTSITAAWIGGTTAINTISGTSMASPHVAGVAALLRSENPSSAAKTIATLMQHGATSGNIDMDCNGAKDRNACSASPNVFLWNGCSH